MITMRSSPGQPGILKSKMSPQSGKNPDAFLYRFENEAGRF